MESTKKKTKKKIIVISSVLAAIVLIAVLVIVAVSATQDSHKEITGKWAVVYRYVDEQGNELNDFVTNEYVEFTEKKFTYYKTNSSGSQTVFETAVKYHYGTGENNKRLKELNRFHSYYISMPDKYGDADFGLFFYGANCAVFGRYSSSEAKYAVLIKCGEAGEKVEYTSSTGGIWQVAGSSQIYTIQGITVQDTVCAKSTVNGFVTYDTGWMEPQQTYRTVYTIYDATERYLVMEQKNLSKRDDGTIRTELNYSVLFRQED